MKNLLSSVITLLIFFNCSSDVDIQTAEMPPPLTDVLTFELAFGADEEKLEAEFLLVMPRGMEVNEDGDIFVVDEDRIKKYDMEGNAVKIIGHPGQGPGEFINAYDLSVSPDGYLVATNKLKGYNLFNPDYKCVEQKNYLNDPKFTTLQKENGYNLNFIMRKIASLNKSKRIFHFDAYKDISKNVHKVVADGLIYDNAGKFHEIAHYAPEFTHDLQDVGGSPNRRVYQLPFQARMLWDMLPEKRVIYTNPAFDMHKINGVSHYVLHIFNLETFERMQITREYTPVDVNESLKSGIYSESTEDYIKFMAKENLKYYYPLHALLTDNNFIFLFPATGYMYGSFKQDIKIEYYVEVLYAGTGDIINTAYFPFVPDLIKNGNAYRRGVNDDGFIIIEKYRIAPSVYGK